MKERPVQYFTDEYLEHCKKLSADQIAEFLESYRLMFNSPSQNDSKSKLISLKVPPTLLAAFRARCSLTGTPYQTKIKELMQIWLERAAS